MGNDDFEGRELMTAENGAVSLLAKTEIDQQIATAHRYPRSIKRFRDEAMQMVTLDESIASECIYALPRDGKTIEGPSARFAEVIASAWGNCRAGARIVSDQGDFVTAQGVFHDLERNVAITYEVQRRITDKNGKRFKPDMIGVTANAACSIALRNAILKGVPKAFWSSMLDAARKVIMGDVKTLANRRAAALAEFQRYGVKAEQVWAKLEVSGTEDIGLDHLVVLRGLLTAIKEGDTTPEQAFASDAVEPIKQPQRASAQKTAEREPPPAAEVETVVDATIVEQGAAPESANPEPPEQEHKAEAPAKPHVKGQATPGFIKMLRDQAAAKGISEAALCEQFQLESLDQGISARLGNELLNFLADVADGA